MANIFVGNLPYEVTEEDLQTAFGQYGTVESVNVIRHRGTGQSHEFAFVEMTGSAEAANAINGLNGAEASWAVDKRERSTSSRCVGGRFPVRATLESPR
jgi:RNA recognition motif-containing protein